jgi:RNA polymerase sigma-70 factor (ECF subfamily)
MPFETKESFEVTALRELEGLYRVAKRLTLNTAEAEDLVGSTMLAACRTWDRFDGRHPRSWLIKILRNEFLQSRRRAAVRNETPFDEAAEPGDECFWQAIEYKLDIEVILQALDQLPEEYRLPIALCDVEEMDYAEAAEALDMPQATLRTRLFRGRKKLQAKLVSLNPSFGMQT